MWKFKRKVTQSTLKNAKLIASGVFSVVELDSNGKDVIVKHNFFEVTTSRTSIFFDQVSDSLYNAHKNDLGKFVNVSYTNTGTPPIILNSMTVV